MCDLNLWIGVNATVVVAPFPRGPYGVFVRRSVLGHSAWLLASLVGTYGVFVPRSVLGSQCVVARFAGRHLLGFVPRSVLGHSAYSLASLVGT